MLKLKLIKIFKSTKLKIMAEELLIDDLKDMKKADFIKAFKNKAAWKKAKAVIVFVAFKLDGKKTTVAVPYKKESEMKADMKRVKKEKIHLFKKSGGGRISFDMGDEGHIANVELTLGGLKPELLQSEGEELFEKINTVLKVVVAEDSEIENEEDNDEKEDEDDVNLGPDKKEAKPEDEKAKIKAIIQELARLQLSLKDEWEQFRVKAKDEGIKFTLPLLGKLQISLKNFKNKIDELAKLSGAETEVQLFLKNYEALKAQLANPALAKGNEALETLKQNTVTMVNDINTFLEKVGFDAKYKIKI
jgi:hypothetical protein